MAVIPASVLEFLSDLKENNTREWFTAQKSDYQKQASEMELALTKLFPKMMREFRSIEDNLWKKETYEIMKDVCKKNPDYLLE